MSEENCTLEECVAGYNLCSSMSRGDYELLLAELATLRAKAAVCDELIAAVKMETNPLSIVSTIEDKAYGLSKLAPPARGEGTEQ